MKKQLFKSKKGGSVFLLNERTIKDILAVSKLIKKDPDIQYRFSGQFAILKKLNESHHQMSQNELAKILDVTPSSVNTFISKLKEKDYISIEKSTQDARKKLIRLTNKGIDLLEKDADINKKWKIFHSLTKEEIEQLDFLLRKILS